MKRNGLNMAMLVYVRLFKIFILYLLKIGSIAYTKPEWFTCEFEVAKCACRNISDHRVWADCSKRKLTRIPVFSSNVSGIDFSDNLVRVISNEFPKNVSYIDLSRNQIEALDGQPFRELYHLKTLNLQRNRINITLFNRSLFSDLHSLNELNLKGNIQNKFKPTIIHDVVFSELRSLQTLKIDGPTNVTFGEGFSYLIRLTTLDLSGITGICSFNVIYRNMFIHMQNLAYLDVSACDIVDIEANAFGLLPNLQHLDVSHNKHLGLASLPNITFNLNRTSIKVLKVSGITCLSGIGTKVRKHHLENLKDTNITEIYLEKNRIEQLEPGALRFMENTLTILSLGENKLTQGKYIIDYFFFKNIRVLNVSVQLRPAPYPESIFEKCEDRTDVLNSNLEEIEDYNASFSQKIQITNLHSNPLYTFYIPKSLEVIYANVSRLYDIIPELGINASGLRELYFQDNFFYAWNGPVHNENVEILDLSNNYCSYISKGFLRYAKGLKVLNLSKNNIGRSLSEDIDGNIFENTVSLEYLDLSQNNIRALPKTLFKNIRKLRKLDIHNNQISDWSASTDQLQNIEVINLQQNRLTTFNKETQCSFEHLFQISNLTIDLSGNKLRCSCENLEFLTWITQHKSHFVKFETYECSASDSRSFNFSSAAGSLLTLKERCKSYLYVYIGCSVIAAFLISLIIGVLLVKNKWKIRYLIFKFKQRIELQRGYSQNFQSQSTGYEYDAMISYSPRELKFVITDLIPHLEVETGLNLYIADRNEPLGAPKGEAIMEAIQNSRRVICLMTQSYLKSKWQDFELNIARMEAIEDRKDLHFVHLILFPEVDKVLKVISDLIRNGCYTEYPGEACAFEEFWKELGVLISKDTE